MKPTKTACAVAVALLLAKPITATTFNIADGDFNGLVGAINSANTNIQDDTINLASNGTYIYTGTLPTITADNGHSLTVNGNNARLHPDSGFFYYAELRFFDINSFKSGASNSVNLRNMILDGGDPTPDPSGFSYGGAVRIRTGSIVNVTGCRLIQSVADYGGAISNDGRLAVYDCTFDRNEGFGGAIYNDADVTVSGSTFTGFGNAGSQATVLANDANVFAAPRATATLTNCTLSNNAGAIYNTGRADTTPLYSASVTLIGCTLSHSDVTNYAQVINNEVPFDLTVTLGNTILVDSVLSNQGFPQANPSEKILSSGYNLSNGNGNGFLNNVGDQLNTDPKLDPFGLQSNGGATQTFALVEGSAAIDKGKQLGVTTDQRGEFRPTNFASIPDAAGGDGSDIGAYEATDFLPANPGSLVVTLTSDQNDGVCGVFNCTLREANNRANAVPGDNTITFGPNATGTILLGSPIDVTTNVAINGPGARVLAVSGNGANRVFSFASGITVSLSRLTIRDGSVTGDFGAGFGAGVFNQGALTINECAFTGNHVQGGVVVLGTGGEGDGGAVYNIGVLAVNRCSFVNNTATGSQGSPAMTFPSHSAGAGGNANGAAIFNDGGGGLTVSNCTFAGNTSTGGPGGSGGSKPGGSGGAARGAVSNNGSLTMTACTLSGNTAIAGPGGSGSPAGGSSDGTGGVSNLATATIQNTILAGNTASGLTVSPNASGNFTSGGYNLVGDVTGSSGWVAADLVGTSGSPINALLGPVQNNGGPTDTMALALAGPEVDKGKAFGLTIDQRGYVRTTDSPVYPNAGGGDGTDIGAYEYLPLESDGAPDSDGDGLSNDFEAFYGNMSPTADNDGDGLTNIQEFHAGTNPTDPRSNLRITAFAKSGSNLDVTFGLAVTGKSYRLERKDALTDSMWGSINGVVDFTAASSGSGIFTDPNGATPLKHFYRVRLLP